MLCGGRGEEGLRGGRLTGRSCPIFSEYSACILPRRGAFASGASSAGLSTSPSMYGSRWRAIAVVTNVWRSGGRSRVTRPQRSEASHPAAPLFVTSALNVCITETEW